MKIAVITLLLLAVIGLAHAKQIDLEPFDEVSENFNEELSADDAFDEDLGDEELFEAESAANFTEEDLTAYPADDEEKDASIFLTDKDWEFETEEEDLNRSRCSHCAEGGYVPNYRRRRTPYGSHYIRVGRRGCGRSLYSAVCRSRRFGRIPGYVLGRRCYHSWGRRRYATRYWDWLTVDYGRPRLRYSRYSFSRCTAFASYGHYYRDPLYQCLVRHGRYYVPGYGDPYGRWCRDAWGKITRKFHWITFHD